jgi:hypothetical protein
VSAIVPSLRHIFFVESGVKHHKPDLAENIYWGTRENMHMYIL